MITVKGLRLPALIAEPFPVGQHTVVEKKIFTLNDGRGMEMDAFECTACRSQAWSWKAFAGIGCDPAHPSKIEGTESKL